MSAWATHFPALVAVVLGATSMALLVDDESASEPEDQTEEAAFRAQLEAFDEAVAAVRSVTADFEERKFTSLLKKPLVSRGRVRAQGTLIRWDTEKPHRSTVLVDQRRLRIYYPARATLEVYELDERLAWLAASPLPRLGALREHFTIERLDPGAVGWDLDPARHLPLRLTPKAPELRDYLTRVDLVLDLQKTCVARSEILDPDGDRTVLLFTNVRTSTDLDGDTLELAVPNGTTVVHPLSGLETGAQNAQAGGGSP